MQKTLPLWVKQGRQIVLVLEKEQADDYREEVFNLGFGKMVKVLVLPESDMGLGYSRHITTLDAREHGLLSFIVSDDDIAPHKDTDVTPMLEFAESKDVLGIGCTTSYHGLLIGNDLLKSLNEPILCPSGWGFRMYALNTENTLAAGNFDIEIPCLCEDAELLRNGISRLGIPWYVHCGVSAISIGKRGEPGGMMGLMGTIETLTGVQEDVHEMVYARWPKYISVPGNKYRMKWAKMMDDYLEGWRKYSIIHGGSL